MAHRRFGFGAAELNVVIRATKKIQMARREFQNEQEEKTKERERGRGRGRGEGAVQWWFHHHDLVGCQSA